MQAKQLVCAAVASLDRHKAEDICTLRVDEVSSLAEYFVIVQGTSTTHVRALCDYVQDELKLIDQLPLRVEGYGTGGWILLDYGGVVIHVFTPQMREFYNLERLWQDGVSVPLEQLLDGSELS